MADDNKIVIRVFEQDALKLKKRFGQPQWEAFRKAIAVAPCIHPEADRVYTSAVVNGSHPGEALNEKDQIKTINGFRCRACGSYVFPDAEEE